MLTCYAVGAQEQYSWLIAHCVSAPLSLILMWLVQSVVALPKIIQDPCLVSRDDAYMGTVIGTMQSMFHSNCCGVF